MLFALDIVAAVIAAVTALAIRFETTEPAWALQQYFPAWLLPVAIRPLANAAFGLHRREWRYASVRELLDLIRSLIVGSAFVLGSYLLLNRLGVPGTSPFPRSFFILEPILFMALAAGARIVVRALLERRAAPDAAGTATPTLVYGAGNAGAIIARMATAGGLRGMRIVGFIDDDTSKRGSRLLGHRVFGGLDDLGHAVERTGASQLLVAIPSGEAGPVRRAFEAAQ
ncbi:MAG: nucleoside-diphosphate sugar epimerase/dehydratase, partial [Candidatus Limnocylindrales bacterium]